jgi:hypothetical protein
MRYRLTVVPATFYEGWQPGTREFSADTDAEAIARSEHPPTPMQFVLPDGDGVDSVPRTLEEIRGMLMYRPVRTVKEW